ncbi:hypothetical protein [Neisseria iguanae]|uniref:hypothetical protein n=1 Tax=Neisseria iguanae TaxID=90242 RepID=UPI0031845A3E
MAFPAVFLVIMSSLWKNFAVARPWFASLIVTSPTCLSVDGAWCVLTDTLSGLLTAYLPGEQK